MPSGQEVVVDVTLTNFIRDYRFQDQMMAQDIVAPLIPVTSFKGRWKELGRELLNIHVSDTGGDTDETNRIDYGVTEKTYEAIERRLKILVTDRELRNAPSRLQLMRQAAITVTHGLRLRQEYRIATLAGATSNTSSPANDWDDPSATIVADIKAGKLAFKAALGMKPTHILIPDHVADEIMGQADIIALLQAAAALSDARGIFNQFDLPATLLGMKTIVPDAMYNSAEPGATESISRIWGDDAYLFSVRAPGMGARWAAQARSLGFTIVRWRSMDPAGWWVKAVHETDEVEVTSEAIHKFVDVT